MSARKSDVKSNGSKAVYIYDKKSGLLKRSNLNSTQKNQPKKLYCASPVVLAKVLINN